MLGTVLLLTAAVSVSPQGLIALINRNNFLDQPILDPGGVTRLCGPDYVAQLWGGAEAGSLSPWGDPVPLRQGAACGYLSGTVLTLEGVAPGQTFAAQLRVWNLTVAPTFAEARTSGSPWGVSNVFFPMAGPDPVTGQFGPAGYLVGLETFALVPEPGTSRLLWIGLLVGWLLRRRPTVANPPRLR